MPVDTPGWERPLRGGLIVRELVNRGHEVTWWSSTFDHAVKKHRFLGDRIIRLSENLRLILLHGRGYQRNVGLGRLLDHQGLGQRFSSRSIHEGSPDLILSLLPPLELPSASHRYAAKKGIPFFVDVSDIWPDSFLSLFPPGLRWAGRGLSRPYYRRAREACAGAEGVLSISRDYLIWGLRMAHREQSETDRIFPLGYSPLNLTGDELNRCREKWVAAGVDPTRFVCCFFGTFSPLRDAATVIEAGRVLERAGDHAFQFVLCGRGDTEARHREAARGISSILMPGRVGAVDIAALMSLSKVGLAPYTRKASQSLPYKPFEYWSAGLPILSSLEGELADLIRDHHCGLQYKAGDTHSLLEALRMLQGNEAERKTMGERAKDLFETRFSAKVIYPALVDHLERFMKKQVG